MGFHSLCNTPRIHPYSLANNVRKHHLPIRFRDLAVLRLCICNQLLVRGRGRGYGDYLSSELWEGFGTLL